MAQPLRVVHDEDPRKVILKEADEACQAIEPMAAGVLLVMYKRPDKLKSGLYIANKTQDEDKYQGKVGLVVKMGPIAFQEDTTHQWGDRKPQVGDWVMVNVGDSYAFDLPNDRRGRIVEDVHVKAIVKQPDVVW